MFRRLIAWTVICALHAGAAAPITLIDDRGRSVRLPGPAQRIVTLAPHLTELAFAAGAGAALVGVAAHSDFPPEAAELPSVASASGLELERLVELKPDLVLAWKSGNRPSDVQRLEALGYPVFITEPSKLDDVPRLLRAIGQLAGTATQAERAALDYERELARLGAHYSKRRSVSVFYQIWDRPLMTIGGSHLITQVIRFCGGRNVFDGITLLAPEVSLESVMAADPDVILVGGGDEGGKGPWPRLPALRAVSAGRVYRVDAALVERATPRLVQGVAEVCEKLERAR